jgi:basic membrane protein A
VKGKFYTFVVILLVLSVVLGACRPAATPTPTPRPTTPPPTAVPTQPPAVTKITVATDATWPPFEYVDETTKEFVGFDIDLMKAIAQEAGFQVEFVNVSWDPLLAGMATGQYDAAISAMTITEERAKQWDFSAPYYAAGQLIAVRIENDTIKGPGDLTGKTLGAQLGTTGAIEVEENHPEATLKNYDDISQAFLDLINRQIDAVVADDPLVDSFVKKYAAEIKAVGAALTSEEYGIAVKKGAPEILAAINKGLKAVMDKGLIAQLKAKWIEVTPTAGIKIGQVTDLGGIDDKSFNATAWKGVEMAVTQLGAEGKFLESQAQADYAKNIQQFLDEKLDLIVTVGFLLGVDTATAAKANPNQNFAIVDYAYPDCWPGAVVGKDCGSDTELANVLGLTFATDEAAFLAGYAAAAMSKTGKIGTFGGIKLPTVTIFMKGLEAGVKYYNQVKGTNVQILGWETAKDEGLFTGNFESTDDGRRFAESLMDEGADIIMPVAGPVGLGSAAACKERGTMLIGVDTDWFVSAPEFQSTYLTSVLKNMDEAVFAAAKSVAEGTFKGGAYVGTLKNNGVGIAAFHDYDSKTPATLKTELDQIKAALIAGRITVADVLAGKATVAKITVGQVTDLGGIDDKSFNATAWKGVEMAVTQLGAEGKFLESQAQADYAKNIQQFLDEKLDLIVTVGFLLGVDTATAAKANPNQNFAIVDYAYPDCWPGAVVGKDCGSDTELANVLGLTFATDEAAFLAGYAAAAMSKTGKIGTFGGIKLPTVTIFMKGLEAGVKYYNQVKGTNVQILGWETAKDEGLFTGNFESTDDGRRFAESLMDEGADIIMPVAGPVGLGSAAACKERGTMLIGVDTDWFVSAPEFQSTYLTSVLKNMDEAVFAAAKSVAEGTFKGGAYVGTLKNNGVGIAAFHNYDSKTPATLKTELDQIKAALIAGNISVSKTLGQ